MLQIQLTGLSASVTSISGLGSVLLVDQQRSHFDLDRIVCKYPKHLQAGAVVRRRITKTQQNSSHWTTRSRCHSLTSTLCTALFCLIQAFFLDRPTLCGHLNSSHSCLEACLIMCTHEIWTYRECGCRYDHHIKCFESLDSTSDDVRTQPSQQPEKHASNHARTNSSPSHLPPSPSPTDSENERHLQKRLHLSDRSCSISRTVHKTFLEPICHECLLAELTGSKSHQENVEFENSTKCLLDSQEHLIWDSDVKIEVGDTALLSSQSAKDVVDHSEEGGIMDSNVEIRVSNGSRPKSFIFPRLHRRDNRSIDQSFHFAGDADSESSEPSSTARGRPRSRSKQLRRMAMDVSREDLRLRISSRLPMFQRQGLQQFKDQLQRGHKKKSSVISVSELGADQVEPAKSDTPRPSRSFMQRLTDARDDRWIKAKGAVQDLGRKMYRKSPSPKRAMRLPNPMGFGYKEDADVPSHIPTGGPDDGNVEVHRSDNAERPPSSSSFAPESFYLQPNDPFHPAIDFAINKTPRGQNNVQSTPVETWRMHLEHDLTTRRQRKDRPVLQNGFLNAEVKPHLDIPSRNHASGSTSTTAVSASTTSRNWQSHPSSGSNPFSHKSYEYTPPNIDDAESGRPLLSVSTEPSVTGAARPASLPDRSSQAQVHRLASLVKNEDFDESRDCNFSVGMHNIEHEMAMVGLTENPWRGASLGPDPPASKSTESEKRSQIAENEERAPIEALSRMDPSTPPPLQGHKANSPPTAIRGSTSSTAIPQDLSTLSGLPNSAPLAYNPCSTDLSLREPSPTPSPHTPFNNHLTTHPQLALHALSTPFHHSLAPQRESTHSRTNLHTQADQENAPLRTIAKKIQPSTSRPQSAPNPSFSDHHSPRHKQRGSPNPCRPWTTVTHTDPRTTPPTAPPGFSLGTSPAGLFSCVWVRSTCPGVVGCAGREARGDDQEEKEEMDDDDDESKPAHACKEGGAVAIEETVTCGRVTGWKVRSCLCTGRVRTCSHLDGVDLFVGSGRGRGGGGKDGEGEADAEGRTLEGREKMPSLDLEDVCRSALPVVRYVRGKELCDVCRRRRRDAGEAAAGIQGEE